jgi:4-amino-4-deoxy-L-arabinose transferase-like glycosyltransferase
MNDRSHILNLEGPRYLAAALVVAALIYLPGQRHGLYRAEDARNAEVARELYVSGNWAVPTLNQEVFLEKPPLFFACVALSYAAFGVSETAARLPCAGFAILMVLGFAVIGKKLKDERLGLLLAAIGASTLYFLERGHEVYLDVFQAMLVTWCLAAFLAAYRPGAAPRLGYLIAFYALAAAAFMTKGVVGIIVPALTVFFYLLWERDFMGFWRLKLWLGALVFIVLTGPWHYELWRQGGDRFLKIFYVDNHYYRFFHGGGVNLGHHKPPWTYLLDIWKDWLPWSVLFPPAFLAWFDKDFRAWLGGPAFRFIVCILAPAFLFFSISSTKRSSYLLPLYGGFAAVVGTWLRWKIDQELIPKWERLYLHGFGSIAIGFGLAIPVLAFQAGYRGPWPWFALLLLPVLAAAVGSVWANRKRGFRASLPVTAALIVATAFFYTLFFLPLDDARYDHSKPSREIAALTREAPEIYCMGDPEGQGNSELERSFIPFYSGRYFRDLSLPAHRDNLPRPGERIPVISIAREKEIIAARRQALTAAGMKIEEAYTEQNRDRYSCLWWVSPAD